VPPPDYLLTLFLGEGVALSQNCEKATISFVVFVRLSVSKEKLGCQFTDFYDV
jgi:hypothetical protein